MLKAVILNRSRHSPHLINDLITLWPNTMYFITK